VYGKTFTFETASEALPNVFFAHAQEYSKPKVTNSSNEVLYDFILCDLF
jgi:hypothetical protein